MMNTRPDEIVIRAPSTRTISNSRPKPEARNPEPSILNPTPYTPNPSPQPSTLNPQP